MTTPSSTTTQHATAAAAAPAALRAAHALVLPAEPPEWVELLPAGEFAGVDGRGPYRLEEPDAVIRRSQSRLDRGGLPIDYGHGLEQPGHVGDAAPAAGWITELQSRDGAIWGRVEWTVEGGRRVGSREYRFLSPVFTHPRQGNEVLEVVGAGLTNRPNLTLKALHTEGNVADVVNLLARLIAVLGLADDASEDVVIARVEEITAKEAELKEEVTELEEEVKELEEGLEQVAQAAGAPKKSKPAAVVRAVQSKTTPDPALFVPRSQYDDVARSLHAAQQRDAERAVEAAIKAGRLTPAQRGWALSYHSQNPSGFAEFIGKQPVIVGEGAERREPGDVGQRQLDETQKAVCAMLGVPEQDFMKNLPEA
jgi:phage I-like protein